MVNKSKGRTRKKKSLRGGSGLTLSEDKTKVCAEIEKAPPVQPVDESPLETVRQQGQSVAKQAAAAAAAKAVAKQQGKSVAKEAAAKEVTKQLGVLSDTTEEADPETAEQRIPLPRQADYNKVWQQWFKNAIKAKKRKDERSEKIKEQMKDLERTGIIDPYSPPMLEKPSQLSQIGESGEGNTDAEAAEEGEVKKAKEDERAEEVAEAPAPAAATQFRPSDGSEVDGGGGSKRRKSRRKPRKSKQVKRTKRSRKSFKKPKKNNKKTKRR